jgi:hypothetical protein
MKYATATYRESRKILKLFSITSIVLGACAPA